MSRKFVTTKKAKFWHIADYSLADAGYKTKCGKEIINNDLVVCTENTKLEFIKICKECLAKLYAR